MFRKVNDNEVKKLLNKTIIDSDFIPNKKSFKSINLTEKEIKEIEMQEYDDKMLRSWINTSKIPKDKGQKYFKFPTKSKEQITKESFNRMHRTHEQFGF